MKTLVSSAFFLLQISVKVIKYTYAQKEDHPNQAHLPLYEIRQFFR